VLGSCAKTAQGFRRGFEDEGLLVQNAKLLYSSVDAGKKIFLHQLGLDVDMTDSKYKRKNKWKEKDRGD
jgi:hypothetical protein